MEQLSEDVLATAVAYEGRVAAIESLLDQLHGRGLGRWELKDVSLDDLADGGALTVPIVASGQSGLLAMCAVESPTAGLTAAHLVEIMTTARVVATLLEADAELELLHGRIAEVEAESVTDSLTGLPNRRGWSQALAREAARCDRQGLTAMIAVIDVDNLKVVNDSEGHLAGDFILRSVGATLTRALRTTDVVARLGGDEFGVLAVDYDVDAPDVLVKRIHAAFDDMDLAASIGACLYEPGADINEVQHHADADMYQAKRASRTARSA